MTRKRRKVANYFILDIRQDFQLVPKDERSGFKICAEKNGHLVQVAGCVLTTVWIVVTIDQQKSQNCEKTLFQHVLNSFQNT